MFKYSIDIIWSDEDQGYIATVPEFKNLSAFGETYEDALKEAKIAIEAYIESYAEEKLPIPEPAKQLNYSGQLRLRMPRELHQKLSVEAMRQDVSLNTFMIYLLSSNYAAYREMQERQQLKYYNTMINLFKNDITADTPEMAGSRNLIKYDENMSENSFCITNAGR